MSEEITAANCEHGKPAHWHCKTCPNSLAQAQATIERQGRAIEALKAQRNTQAFKANPSFEEKFILELIKSQYDSEIETILNGESNDR